MCPFLSRIRSSISIVDVPGGAWLSVMIEPTAEFKDARCRHSLHSCVFPSSIKCVCAGLENLYALVRIETLVSFTMRSVTSPSELGWLKSVDFVFAVLQLPYFLPMCRIFSILFDERI